MPRELGGQAATRGFYYQCLYSLRLMEELLEGRYCSYATESLEDYSAWSNGAKGTNPRWLLVQVKTSLDRCVFTRQAQLSKVFRGFSLSAKNLQNPTSITEICFRLVVNSHDSCIPKCKGEAKIRSKAWFVDFEKEMASIFPSASVLVEFEHFLTIPLNRQQLVGALSFLEKYDYHLLKLLASQEAIKDLVASVIGTILPFHTGRSRSRLREGSDRTEFGLLSNHPRDREDVVSDLRKALQTAADSAERVRQGRAIDVEQSQIELRAARLLESARLWSENTSSFQGLDCPDRDSALRALNIYIRLSENSKRTCLFPRDRIAIFANPQTGIFRVIPTVLETKTTVRTLVKRASFTHLKRIELIQSFLTAVEVWANAGMTLIDFRAESVAYRHLYAVEIGTDDELTFIMGDLGALTTHDPASSMIDPQFLNGGMLARAIRYLYYGVAKDTEVAKTELFRQRWNDNVIGQIADWLANCGVVRANLLRKEFSEVFSDESCSVPIFFHSVDEQFIRDIADAGIRSVADALTPLRPRSILADRGQHLPSVLYAFTQQAQIGLLPEAGAAFTLYRYVPYGIRRWNDRYRRDLSSAVELDVDISSSRSQVIFIGVDDPSTIPMILTDVFGISIEVYEKWLSTTQAEARALSGYSPLPAVLREEELLLQARRANLDSLSQTTMSFTLPIEGGGIESKQVVELSLESGFRLAERLREIGYPEPDDSDGLEIQAVDGSGKRLSGSLMNLGSDEAEETIQIQVRSVDEEFSDHGTFRIKDPGSEAVVSSEESLLRELRFAFSGERENVPAYRAWMLLQRYLVDKPLQERSTLNLWNGALRHPRKTEEDQDSKLAAEAIVSDIMQHADGHGTVVIRGAAGTGKTQVAVDCALEYLSRRQGQLFPPPRVLIVGASHYAIDNYLRQLLERCDENLKVYRAVPEMRVDALLNRGTIDRILWANLQRRWYHAKSDLPMIPRGISGNAPMAMLLGEVTGRVTALEQECSIGSGHRDYALLPGHERWRRLYGEGSGSVVEGEQDARLNYLRQKLSDLRSVADAAPTEPLDRFEDSQELYMQFSAEVVATTADAFGRLPDMNFDLVVFEESSQLGFLKVVNVLTKVVRAIGPDTKPTIIFCGDSQQLPPFVESFPEQRKARGGAVSRLSIIQSNESLRGKETFFDRLCTSAPYLLLENQYRMDPDIATLVNSLFYSDQTWRCLRPTEEGHGVYWVDTQALDPKFEPSGTSLYNLTELSVVKKVVQNLDRRVGDILIISPYAAQVFQLRHSFQRPIQVRTIDGCQGIQADIVIVSFVTLNFSRARDFVVDPRRMNVALSRACKQLFLVGNLGELRRSLRTAGLGQRFAHLRGLAALFDEEGIFHNRILEYLP